MDKQTLLQEVTAAAAQRIVTRDELNDAYDAGAPDTASHHVTLPKVLYYLGGTVIFIGIAVLLSQNWEALSIPVRIIVTLGSAVAAYLMGVLFNRYDNLEDIGQAFYFISGLTSPIGLGVLLDSLGMDIGRAGVGLAAAAVLCAAFLVSFFLLRRRAVCMIFSIIFGTFVFHYLLRLVTGDYLLAQQAKLYEYEAMVVGLAYLSLGYYFVQTDMAGFSGVLYSFGSIFFLGAALALGGWSPNQNIFWELFYPILVFGVIFLSVSLKSRALLIFGSLFLIGYILKLTGEYFASSLSWPLALVLAGFAIMLVGYYAFRINKKYLNKAATD